MGRTISVIIPVYNVEEYLAPCLESVIGQDYRDLEILLIDDGSTDGSGKICDAYAQKDERIHVIHQKNGGAAAAKNAGLRIATGKYLSFVDSDDTLAENAYAFMVEKIETQHADVIQCGFNKHFTDGMREVVSPSQEQQFDAAAYLMRFTSNWTCGLLWDKLYRRSLFDGIYFEEGYKIDDEFFTYQGIMNAQTVIYVPKVVYNYRQRASSVMKHPTSAQQIVMDKLDYLSKRRINVIRRFPQLKQAFDYHYLNALVILSRDAHGTQESIRRIKELLNAYFAEKQPCKAEWRLWLQLLKLRCLPVDHILKHKTEAAVISDQNRYFD